MNDSFSLFSLMSRKIAAQISTMFKINILFLNLRIFAFKAHEETKEIYFRKTRSVFDVLRFLKLQSHMQLAKL